MTFGIDFGTILAPSWVQNGTKINTNGCRKNDEKMMMPKMAKKLDIGGYECIRHHGFGGGVNPSSSTIVQEEGLDVGMDAATQGRNHLSPRGLVGFKQNRL